MKATEAMVCWNPGSAEVQVVRWPDRRRSSCRYQCRVDPSGIQRWTFVERQWWVFSLGMHLIVADRCDPQAVNRALLGIEEYEEGCSEDMPGVIALPDVH